MSGAAVAGRSLTDREIAGCFNSTLGRRHRVRLIGGSEEPVYLPACGFSVGGSPDGRFSTVCSSGMEGWATIRYTCDYPASVLHEIAHWCIAGASRRRRLDYGYWYCPPPRTDAEQAAFAEVEERVQALESLFSTECGLEFQVSVDDVDGNLNRTCDFARRVADRAGQLGGGIIPARAVEFLATLRNFRIPR